MIFGIFHDFSVLYLVTSIRRALFSKIYFKWNFFLNTASLAKGVAEITDKTQERQNKDSEREKE